LLRPDAGRDEHGAGMVSEEGTIGLYHSAACERGAMPFAVHTEIAERLAARCGGFMMSAADRYPGSPVRNPDVQTTWYVDHAVDLLRAIEDPRRAVVEFDPLSTSFTDPDFLRTPAARALSRDVRGRLEARFARRDDLAAPFVLWTRTR
jgi:hypothetical protein